MVRFVVALVLCALGTMAVAEELRPALPDAIARQAQAVPAAPNVGDHPGSAAPATDRLTEAALRLGDEGKIRVLPRRQQSHQT